MNNELGAVPKQVRIDRIYPADLQSHFVSNIVVQHQPDVFILSFFEMWPPAVLGDTEEERLKAIDAVDHVEAKCVARLAVTPAKMRQFVEALTDNLQHYEKLMAMGLDLGEGE